MLKKKKFDHLVLGPAAGQGLPDRLHCRGKVFLCLLVLYTLTSVIQKFMMLISARHDIGNSVVMNVGLDFLINAAIAHIIFSQKVESTTQAPTPRADIAFGSM